MGLARAGRAAAARAALDQPGRDDPEGDPCVRISLTMIVRNEENNISKCLESAGGTFDEIVVVDTGSTDRTKEIAREFGARVFQFAWIDNFAARGTRRSPGRRAIMPSGWTPTTCSKSASAIV